MKKKIFFEAIPPDTVYSLKEILREKAHDLPELKTDPIGAFGSGRVLSAYLTSDDKEVVDRVNALLAEMEKVCIVRVISSRL